MGVASPPGAGEPRTDTVRTGLRALAELMEVPEIRASVRVFESALRRAYEQGAILAAYKDLHDLLHRVQHECYDQIFQTARRYPDDDTARDDLETYELRLGEISAEMRQVRDRGVLPPTDAAWIDGLEQTRAGLRAARRSFCPGHDHRRQQQGSCDSGYAGPGDRPA